jgi:hypothetical protein
MAKMQRQVRGHIATTLQRGATPRASGATKEKRGKDDDGYVIPVSPWVPAGRDTVQSQLVARRGRRLAGRAGRKELVGWLVGYGPHKEVKVSYLT